MSEPTRLPPSVGRAIPGDLGIARDSLLRQFNIQEPVTGGWTPWRIGCWRKMITARPPKRSGLPDDPATRSVHTRLRRRLLYDFDYARENELSSSAGDPTTSTRAFEKRVTPRLTVEENGGLSKFIRDQIEADQLGIHLGDPAAAGAIIHETPFGTKRESGPLIDPLPFPLEPKQSDVIDRLESSDTSVKPVEAQLILASAEFGDNSVHLTASAPTLVRAPHIYSLSIRPGETKTQVIELPGLTLALTITMPSMLPRAV